MKRILINEQQFDNIIANSINENGATDGKVFLGYHSSVKNMDDGFYKGRVLDIDTYSDIIRNAYMEIISDYDENLENDDVDAMNDTFRSLGYGFTYVSKNPIDASNFQYSKYKYGDYLYKVYGNGNELLLDDVYEINADIIVSKEPLYFEKYSPNQESLINEKKDYYDFWDINYVYDTISEFLADKKKGFTRKHWRLIPFEQYRNALIEFMRYGQFMRFPAKYIDAWADIVTENTLTIQACTELTGHTQWFPFDEFCDAFGFENDTEEYEKYYGNFQTCSDYLNEIGFYDWMYLPDGSDAMSDFGMEPLLKLIMELEEQTTPEQKIVVINKLLDVYHQRGDLASAFIEGGSKSLSQISQPEMVNENIAPQQKNQLLGIANKLVQELNQIGIGSYIWHAATTGSVYIRFDDNRMGSIRIADHEGRNKLKYKYNLRTDLKLSKGQWVKDDGKWRYYLPMQLWKELIPVLVKQHEYIQNRPEAKYQYTIPKFKQKETPIEEMAYPESFNMETFKSIKSFAGRVKYCREKLRRIAEGSSRMVFQIDDEKVLKLAKNQNGIIQNEAEATMGANEGYFTCIAYVYDFDDEHYRFIEMENARKCTYADFERISGFHFNTFVNFIQAEQSHTLYKEFSQEFIDQVYEEDTFIKEMSEFIHSWNMETGDIYRLGHYGVVRRNGQEYLVLIDYGLTEKTLAKIQKRA